MKNTRWTIMAALLLAATSVTHAQEGAPAPGAPAPAGATDSGAVSNAQTTTTTTTSSTGIAPEGDAMAMGETTELANTGGEPILMSVLGLSVALGALALRKRAAV